MWHPESIYDADGHLDEGVLHAWIDGELAADDARAVAAHAGTCAACAARVAEARGMVAGSSRILSALDDDAGKSIGRLPSAVGRSDIAMRRRGWSTRRLSLAAAAALVFVAGTVVARDGWQAGASREAVRAPEIATSSGNEKAAMMAERSAPASAPVAASGSGPASATAAASSTAAPRSDRGAPVSSVAPQASSRRIAGKVGAPGNVAQGTAALRGAVEGQPRRMQSRPGSAATASVPAATTEASPVAPPAAVPAPAAPVPAATVGAATALRATASRPSFPSAQDLKLEPVVVTGTEAASDTRLAVRERAAADRPAAGRVEANRVPSAVSAALDASPPNGITHAILAGCWRIGASDSTLRIGSTPSVASLVVRRGTPMPIRLEAADTVPVVRFWPAAAPVADSTGRVVQRSRLVQVECR